MRSYSKTKGIKIMNIQELEAKYKELGAEIQRLKRQPQGVWEPKIFDKYYTNNSSGQTIQTNFYDEEEKAHHNIYKTEALAEKASVLQRRSNLVIQACLNFDPDFVPDFVPDWCDEYQLKHGFYYSHELDRWIPMADMMHEFSSAYVSSRDIAEKVVEYLNSQEIKW